MSQNSRLCNVVTNPLPGPAHSVRSALAKLHLARQVAVSCFQRLCIAPTSAPVVHAASHFPRVTIRQKYLSLHPVGSAKLHCNGGARRRVAGSGAKHSVSYCLTFLWCPPHLYLFCCIAIAGIIEFARFYGYYNDAQDHNETAAAFGANATNMADFKTKFRYCAYMHQRRPAHSQVITVPRLINSCSSRNQRVTCNSRRPAPYKFRPQARICIRTTHALMTSSNDISQTS